MGYDTPIQSPYFILNIDAIRFCFHYYQIFDSEYKISIIIYSQDEKWMNMNI